MRKFIPLTVIAVMVLLLAACQRGKHFISDPAVREQVEKQFKIQEELAKNRSEQLFSVFKKKDVDRTEREALKFLYAYMSLSDLADYDGEFFLKNVRASLAARDTFSWGKQVPEDIFRHFVLPVRVNNENLDSSRWVFFGELKDRIRKLSMKDAVLEVNHWCHEKVTYRGSDDRTSAPLATVRNALGRCGEESTFAVAALRAAGIPARQCYTPRWAHCDDNHAWVEVWVDGKWHYIGACEPEALLDRAWFTAPAMRAMLVNTNVFGDYRGPEDVLLKDPRYTRINLLANYADTKRIFVLVKDEGKHPVDNAIVEFQLYNYSEFYPLTKTWTDKNGLCSFLTGFGDLVVWGAKGDKYTYGKVTVKNTDTLSLTLDLHPGRTTVEEMDLVPPQEKKVESTLADSLKKKNDDRLAFEDRLRSAYEKTFIDSAKAWRLAANLKLAPDTLWDILHRSRGNWREIIDFITSVPDESKYLVFPLLNNISEKDLQDVTPDVLADQVSCSLTYKPLTNDKSILYKYILSPRIDAERLRSFKSCFQKAFEKSFAESARKDPSTIIQWIKSYIITDNTANYSRSPLTPIGTYELKVADKNSRNILFVALCRSFGIPARLETATRIPQYMFNEKWNDVLFERPVAKEETKCRLILEPEKASKRKPEYYINFTIQKQENGFFRTLDYEKELSDAHYPYTLELAPGPYLLMTGTRLGDGTVLTRLTFFMLMQGEEKKQGIIFRDKPVSAPVLADVGEMTKFVSSVCDDASVPFNHGVVIAWVEPGNEPSRHLLADISLRKDRLADWKGSFLLLFTNKETMAGFLAKSGKTLPGSVICRTALRGSSGILAKSTGKKIGENLPIVTMFSPKGELNYLSEGYRIGTCDELLQLMK